MHQTGRFPLTNYARSPAEITQAAKPNKQTNPDEIQKALKLLNMEHRGPQKILVLNDKWTKISDLSTDLHATSTTQGLARTEDNFLQNIF